MHLSLSLPYRSFKLQSDIIIASSAVMSAALAISILTLQGFDKSGIIRALQVTARFSFLFFWLAYAGGALSRLFGHVFDPIARQARLFGLSFAAAQSVHIILVIALYQISSSPPVPQSSAVFFGVAVFWMYLLVLLSFKQIANMLTSSRCKMIRFIGSEYISFAFFVDFAAHPLSRHPVTLLAYLPFLLLSISGIILRILSYIMKETPELSAH